MNNLTKTIIELSKLSSTAGIIGRDTNSYAAKYVAKKLIEKGIEFSFGKHHGGTMVIEIKNETYVLASGYNVVFLQNIDGGNIFNVFENDFDFITTL